LADQNLWGSKHGMKIKEEKFGIFFRISGEGRSRELEIILLEKSKEWGVSRPKGGRGKTIKKRGEIEGGSTKRQLSEERKTLS